MEQNLRKRIIFHILAAFVVGLLLFVLPLIEEYVRNYLATEIGILIDKDGTISRSDGALPRMLTSTSIALAVNIFHLIKVILGMAMVIIIVRMIIILLFRTVLRRSSQSEIASLLKTVLSIVIYIVAFFIIFQSEYPNVNLGALFTGSTILGIVVGLALQDTLGNLFAGIAIQADQPFQVGDVVTISNRGSGVVESVSWRGIKIRTFQNKLIIISNAVMSRETIEVAPKNNLNARLVRFNTVYTASPSRTAQLVREAVRHVDNVSQKMRPVVRIRDLGDNGIDWEVKYWCDNYVRYNDTDAQIRQRIWYVFNREGIDFAFPTRTVHIEEKPVEQSIEELTDTRHDQLAAVPLFAPLSDDELHQLARSAVARIFAPGESIVRKGQHGNSMFVIIRGSVKVQIPQGSSIRTVGELSKGDFFGEMGLLTGEPRTANVIAEDETEVLQIRKEHLQPIVKANPKLAELISDIVEERRSALESAPDESIQSKPEREKGVLRSLRKFFGME
ncbi:mechanosensitive ion channel family protein [Leptolyngbya sp. 7M]|uniref:mechanosensitive ion channel family protein n=1 Tax=Leptolyngbya sp. 7M TaxID=2812896 RepID=UPI001B8D528C|nr:mechanosensitive ion channel family protein [Leptolyngbya sp. 7M]QYO66809.1 mechanosensitive ion channel family protein [Leptolyngbya sp. 7M]